MGGTVRGRQALIGRSSYGSAGIAETEREHVETTVRQRPAALRLADLLALTKPRQTVLLLVTGICSYTLSRGMPLDPHESLAMVAGLLLSISGTTALNMLVDRDIDSMMTRTAKRPLPRGSISPWAALIFGTVLAGAGLAISFALDSSFGLVVATGLLIDLLIYTVWLKRRTPLSIAFGGVAGGMPILAGRVLAVGRVDGIGILLASSVLLWIPSHILTLAIRYADDYQVAEVPVWPNVYGPQPTRVLIAAANLLNTLVLVSAGLLLEINVLALGCLVGMSAGMLVLSVRQLMTPTERSNWFLFKVASLYMLASSLLLTVGALP